MNIQRRQRVRVDFRIKAPTTTTDGALGNHSFVETYDSVLSRPQRMFHASRYGRLLVARGVSCGSTSELALV